MPETAARVTVNGSDAGGCIPLSELGFKTILVQGKTLWQNGKAVGQIEGVTLVGENAGYTCFTVAPGTWEFVAR